MSSRHKKRMRINYDPNSDSDGPPAQYTGGEMSVMNVQHPSNNNNMDESFDQARLRGNSFAANAGPQRRLEYPENAQFMESMGKYDFPKQIVSADKRSPISASITTREENFPEPKMHHIWFQRIGRNLKNSSESEPAPEPTFAALTPGVTVDSSQPSTSIKLWLYDGTSMIAQLNYHNTIADIRSFINASRPGERKPYKLQAGGFPHKVLDDTQTIEQAGLLNSVVIQTF